MVSDQELASCVESLLRQAGPGGAAESIDGVVRQLEARLGLDLSHKTSFIQDQIDSLLGFQRLPKDHFARHPHPHFHPNALQHPHHYLQFPAGTNVYPVPHLPHHHQLVVRHHPSPIPPAAPAPAPAIGHQHLQHQQQHQEHQPEPTAMPAAIAAPTPKESTVGVKRRGGPGGLNKLCGVSPELQAIVGEPTMARTQIVKQLWAYIRKNNLQDPSNKRKIICNDELRLVFETDCTDMFKMNKLLAKHIITLQPTKEPGAASKKLKADVPVVSASESDAGQNCVVISDALSQFFGTEERKMLQSEASMHIWDYIKANQLEDPMNPMVILCDSKLQQLFGCESLSALGISEMLDHHLFKQS